MVSNARSLRFKRVRWKCCGSLGDNTNVLVNRAAPLRVNEA